MQGRIGAGKRVVAQAGGLTKFGMSEAQAFAVENQLGVIDEGHAAGMGKWIALKAGSSQYTSLATDIRVTSIETVLPQVKGTTLATETIPGPGRVYVLKWATAASSSNPALSSTITFPVTGPTLPIQEVTTAKGSKETVTLSKWGEFVHIAAPPPSQTIAYATVSG